MPKIVRALSEVRAEEISKRRNSTLLLLGWRVHFLSSVAGHGWLEEDGSSEGESLHFWMQELSSRVDPTSLQSVAGNVIGMRVVSGPLESSEPGSCVHKSLSEFLGLISATVEFSSHII